MMVQVTQSFVRDTLIENAGPSGHNPELAAVQAGNVINWDAFESLLDEILYSKVCFEKSKDSFFERVSYWSHI